MTEIRLIDANALKEAIQGEWFVEPNATIFNYVFNIIDNAPTVDMDERDADAFETGYIKGICEQRPQGEWINAKECLPDDMTKVLVWFEYYRYGDYNCMFQTFGFGYVCDGEWSSIINGETGWKDARIIAWCPLPEPYRTDMRGKEE